MLFAVKNYVATSRVWYAAVVITVEPVYNSHLGDRGKPASVDGRYGERNNIDTCNYYFFWGGGAWWEGWGDATFLPKKMFLVAYKYVEQSKYIKNTKNTYQWRAVLIKFRDL